MKHDIDLYISILNDLSGDSPKMEMEEQDAAAGGGGGDRKSTRLNSSHVSESRMPSSA